MSVFFFFQAEDGIRDRNVTGVQTCALPICSAGLSHYMASKRNRKVLCFSTDPQASLSDIFDRDIFGKGLISVIPQLDVVEIDADRRVADYQGEVDRKSVV